VSVTDILYQFGNLDILPETLYNFITKRIISCIDHYEALSDNPVSNPYLAKTLDYFTRFFKQFVEIIYSRVISLDSKQKESLRDILAKIKYFIYETYAQRMIKRIFDIILEAEEININIIREIREAVEESNMVIISNINNLER
jgi:hypothetical protein